MNLFYHLALKSQRKRSCEWWKGILKNGCSWNFKKDDTLELQEHHYSRTLFNFHSFQKHLTRGGLWKKLLLNFRKCHKRMIWLSLSKNPSKISVKELTFQKFVDLQPTTLPKTSSFKVFFRGFFLLLYFP